MRVKAQVPFPGVQHREHPGQRAQMTFLRAELLDGFGRDLHQEAVHELLLTPEEVLQLPRDGGHGMKIVARQKLGLTLFQPLSRLSSMTFRTGAVAAAVITPERLATVVAAVQPSAHFCRATGGDVGQGPSLRGHQLRPVLRRIVGTKPTDHVRQFDIVARGVGGW